MIGQDAVKTAAEFDRWLTLDGFVLSKLDGDARGGAALSIKAVTGKPVLYASTGEKLAEFELFHPDRMASRILGMGDMLSFIESAEKTVDAERAAELERKIRKQEFGLDDFLDQMKQIRRMGPIGNLLGMLPGFGQLKQLKNAKVDERELDRIQAIVTSMTLEERRNPKLIDGSRRKRIAAGSGTTVQAVNQLVKQFGQMQKMMRSLQQGKMPSMEQLMRGGM
jgi:signal recognition particle subunit SRP54